MNREQIRTLSKKQSDLYNQKEDLIALARSYLADSESTTTTKKVVYRESR